MNIHWDAEDYKAHFGFVHRYGEDVLELIDAPRGALVVDLGCGNGALSEKLKARGYRVLRLDASSDMLSLAQKLHPDISFRQADATEFELSEKADVIFSNAVLHWIDESLQEKLAGNLAAQLKTGGRLVCEFGGKGCAEAVHSTLEKCFKERGLVYPRTFYFPTIGEYAPLLEKYGLLVEYASLFERPTPQETENGLADWIGMFVKKPFEGMEPALREEILSETTELLRDRLCVDGIWYIDYMRIRIRARKIS